MISVPIGYTVKYELVDTLREQSGWDLTTVTRITDFLIFLRPKGRWQWGDTQGWGMCVNLRGLDEGSFGFGLWQRYKASQGGLT